MMRHNNYDNEGGDTAAIFIFVFTIVIIGWLSVAIIYPVNFDFKGVIDNLTQSGVIPLSQAHQDSMANMWWLNIYAPFIIFLFLIFALIVVSIRKKYSQV